MKLKKMKEIVMSKLWEHIPNAKSEASMFKTKGLERSTISINSGLIVKEAFKDWKALTSTPHEKGWSFRIKQVRKATIVEYCAMKCLYNLANPRKHWTSEIEIGVTHSTVV